MAGGEFRKLLNVVTTGAAPYPTLTYPQAPAMAGGEFRKLLNEVSTGMAPAEC
jgi:hypothetical protein